MTFVIPLVILVVLGVVWGMASVARSKEILRLRAARTEARTVLTIFARSAMLQTSVSAIVDMAGEAAAKIFGTPGLHVITENQHGDFTSLRASDPVARNDGHEKGGALWSEGPRAWFSANPTIVSAADLSSNEHGAMTSALEAMMATCGADVIVPLVHKGDLLAVLGLAIARKPSYLDRELLRIFRLEVTAACANVHLYEEVLHLHSLVDEVDVATGLELSLIPKEMSGRVGKFKWHGHYRSAEQAGSDFWGMYPLGDGRVLVVVGDSVGRRLAGAMVSASVKSCCDQIVADRGASLDPGELLNSLNASLFQATLSALASCSVAILDPMRSQLTYANAGHVRPYRVHKGKEGLALTVLQATGPLLGDVMDPEFPVHKQRLGNADSVIFLTDGLLGQRDAKGDSYGYRRFHKLLKAQATTEPEEISNAVLAGIAAHSADEKLRDDQALLVVKWA